MCWKTRGKIGKEEVEQVGRSRHIEGKGRVEVSNRVGRMAFIEKAILEQKV